MVAPDQVRMITPPRRRAPSSISFTRPLPEQMESLALRAIAAIIGHPRSRVPEQNVWSVCAIREQSYIWTDLQMSTVHPTTVPGRNSCVVLNACDYFCLVRESQLLSLMPFILIGLWKS